MINQFEKQLYFNVKHRLKMVRPRIFGESRLKFSIDERKFKVDMKMFPLKNIRNFGIIAHVDHGKSTLSDRLMEFAGNISKKNKNEQVLDKLQVERERGITVKAQTVSLFHEYNGEMFLLNLIDTPGHVDFSSEVNRSLVACQGVVLLVDSNQVSAKQGTGIVDVMNSVIEKIPPPKGNLNQHFRALQYDSWYSKKQGVTCLVFGR